MARTTVRREYTARENANLAQVHDLLTKFTRIGRQTFSGDGTTTEFTWPHGLPDVHGIPTDPQVVLIGPMTDHAAEHPWRWDAAGGNVTIIFETAPTAGTDNVVFCYLIMG